MNKIFTILLLILISILSIGCGKTSDISESAKGTVETIFDFYSPELDRNCTVTIYLPPNYAQSELSYPVIYMFDGQNLFDAETATYHKEWQIDELIDSLYAQQKTNGFIVVGVDSLKNRTAEYNLYTQNPMMQGNGKALETGNFYSNTLKPYIDEQYRTLPEREHTGIIGSSYGAIAATCTCISHPDTYGFIGLYSYYDNQNPQKMRAYFTQNITADTFGDTPIYFFAGTSDFAKNTTEIAFESAKLNDLTRINYEIGDGMHDEYAWSAYFASCLAFWEWI